MKRIAIVEDNADNRLLVEAILSELCAIDQYETGDAALAGMNASPPDLVLLDISLPGMDGVEVLRRMRGENALAHLPVVALTAHAMTGDREKYLAKGFDGYITKPILDENILIAEIERFLKPDKAPGSDVKA